MHEHRRNALLGAVARETPDWSGDQREIAAAMLDMLWDIPPYNRLMVTWGFDANRAIGAITWAISLIEEAIRQGRRPDLRE